MQKSVRKKTSRKSPTAAMRAAKKRVSGAAKRTKAQRPSMLNVVAAALDDLKAADAVFLDVRHLTSVTDDMVIASGRSDRHVRAIASAVAEQCKKAGYRPLGIEGEKAGEWVLVDLGDVVLHVMLPRVREFYNLEKLWDITAREADVAAELGT